MDRRTFLRATGAAGAGALLVPSWLRTAVAANGSDSPFRHGVASGDPLTDRVMLWTRVSGTPGPAEVSWTVAIDPGLSDVVASGTATTDGSRDHTVKVDAGGLAPGRTYFYGFEVGGKASPTGRTRTAPEGPLSSLRFALASCSDWEFGFFHAYARLAERDDLAFVVHVGDYIYEHGTTLPFNPLGRVPDPPHELVSLDDYRRRYAQHRGDPMLREAHRVHPWVVVWDDHEFANNAWQDGAENHDPEDGAWPSRLAAARRAWAEWMPVRIPDPDDPLRIWRRLRFGDLVDLVMLDTRIYGRNEPATDTGPFGTESNDPDRRLLGETQMRWLENRLRNSKARWKVLGQQVMMAPHTYAGALPPLPDRIEESIGLREGGAAEGNDNWNAYTAERARLLEAIRSHGVDDVVTLTGDIHSSWGADLVNNPYDTDEYDPLTAAGSAGAELVTTSVTSPNLGDAVRPPATEAINQAVLCENPNVKHVNLGGHGYVLVDVSPERLRGEWWYVESIWRDDATGQTMDAAAEIGAGSNHLRPVTPLPYDPCAPSSDAPTT